MANGEGQAPRCREAGNLPDLPNRIDEFVDVTRRYRAQYIWMVQRMAGFTDDAEDIVQLAFMRAYAGLEHFRGDARISTWLRTIVQHTALEHLRSRKGRVFVSLDSDGDRDGEAIAIELHDIRPTPEQDYSRRELAQILTEEVDRLSSFSRRAIQMCLLEESSQGEAAVTLDVTVGTIKSRIFRGKQHLHHALDAQFGAKRICGSISGSSPLPHRAAQGRHIG